MTFHSKAIEFNLSAVDWRSVSLLEGAHLTADRGYIEEIVRCALHFSGRWGVARLEEDDLVSGEASADAGAWSVGARLRRCFAITPQGYLICWDAANQPGEAPTYAADSSRAGDLVPLYLCVDSEPEEAYAAAPQEIHGDHAFVRRRLRLASETGWGELDALKIGQLKRAANSNNLQFDKEFIPECLRLDSHWLLRQRVEAIKAKAKTCLENLMKQTQANTFLLETMATPLATATVLEDWTISPYAYLERMLVVMRALFTLQYRIADEGNKAKVYSALDAALRYIEPNLTADALDWSKALKLIEAAFIALEGVFTGQARGWKIQIDEDIR